MLEDSTRLQLPDLPQQEAESILRRTLERLQTWLGAKQT